MRTPEPVFLLTFDSTVQAMAVEKFCTEHHLPGRLIPLPAKISADCGLAWKTSPEHAQTITEALAPEGLHWDGEHFILL